MLTHNELRQVLQTAVSTGGDFAELFFEDRSDTVLKNMRGSIGGVTTMHIYGVGLYVLHGVNSVYVYSNDASFRGLMELAQTAAEIIPHAGKDGAPKNIVFTRQSVASPNPIEIHPSSVGVAEKKRILREMEQAAYSAGPAVRGMNLEYFDNVQNVTIVNTEGLYAEDRRPFCRVRLSGTVEWQDKVCYRFGDFTKPSGFEAFRDGDYVGFAQNFVRKIENSLKAKPVKPCVVPVVFEGGLGVFWHEACGHNLESSAAENGCFAGKEGQRIASEKVTLMDDGSIPGLCGSEAIDDEGHPTQSNVLIENGIMRGYLCDRLGGRKLGCGSTGSGRRQNYTYAPCPRMHNTFLAPGNDDEEEMIASVDNGLLVTELGGGSSGDNFSIAVTNGCWIRDGKLAEPVGNMMLSGTTTEIVKRVDRVGRIQVYDYDGGFCGAASGLVQTTNFQPRFRVSAMRVGGASND